MSGRRVRAFAPGRVNLMGDHTDYTGGLVMPMALTLGTTVSGLRGGATVHLVSDAEPVPADVALTVADPPAVEPAWSRFVAAVVSEVRPRTGLLGQVTSSLPIGAGVSSSAALEVAVALALGFGGAPLELALVCQRAEQLASGVPCGVMDQLASAAGVAGHALLIDCAALTVTPTAIPAAVEIRVVPSGEVRALTTTAYAERRAACEAAEAIIGPLRAATLDRVEDLDDPVLRRRARHVVTENARVKAFAASLQAGDLPACGRLMIESHWSLASDFEVSTPRLDDLVRTLVARPGVYGARLTGAGFGGSVVALAEPGAIDEGRRVTAGAGARLIDDTTDHAAGDDPG